MVKRENIDKAQTLGKKVVEEFVRDRTNDVITFGTCMWPKMVVVTSETGISLENAALCAEPSYPGWPWCREHAIEAVSLEVQRLDELEAEEDSENLD